MITNTQIMRQYYRFMLIIKADNLSSNILLLDRLSFSNLIENVYVSHNQIYKLRSSIITARLHITERIP